MPLNHNWNQNVSVWPSKLHSKNREKVYITLHLSAVDYLTPEPIKLGIPHPNISKTGQITRHAALDGGFVVFLNLFQMNHQKIIEKLSNKNSNFFDST